MLNRRHLRIKVLQALYAYFQAEEDNYGRSEKAMLQDIEQIYSLHLCLLLSFEELKIVAEQRVEENKNKLRPTAEDTDPNLKFINNRVFSILEESKNLRHLSQENKVSWVGDVNREMFRKIFNQLREEELYISFMNSEEDSFEHDMQYAISMFKTDIANSPLMYHFFEEKSISWLDDIDLACSMVLKTIKSIKEGEQVSVLPLYKDPEDEIPFVKTLLRKTIVNDKENLELIDKLTSNWELDRIAKMDIILMKMAITEFQEFNEIPTKVTLNEYIEISKFYSTPKSNGFINGVLDKAIELLKSEGKIKKVGRGLIS